MWKAYFERLFEPVGQAPELVVATTLICALVAVSWSWLRAPKATQAQSALVRTNAKDASQVAFERRNNVRARVITEEEWPDMACLVRDAYMADAPDAPKLKELINSCKVKLEQSFERASWPMGWLENVDDIFWLKFLIASHFKVEKAVSVATAYLDSHRLEDVIPRDRLEQHFDGRFIAPCVTHRNMVVAVLRLRYYRPSVPLEEVKEWFCTCLDSVIAWNMVQRSGRTTKNKLERYILVIDVAGASRANSDLKAAKALVSLAQSRYPDFMDKAYLINASRALLLVWSLIKPVLDVRMQQKYEILARGSTKLTEIISLEYLPKSLGGRAEEWLPPERMSPVDQFGVLFPVFFSADDPRCFGGCGIPCLARDL